MIHTFVFTWWVSLGYPYTPPRDLWLNSGGIPRYGFAAITSHRPALWARIEW